MHYLSIEPEGNYMFREALIDLAELAVIASAMVATVLVMAVLS